MTGKMQELEEALKDLLRELQDHEVSAALLEAMDQNPEPLAEFESAARRLLDISRSFYPPEEEEGGTRHSLAEAIYHIDPFEAYFELPSE